MEKKQDIFYSTLFKSFAICGIDYNKQTITDLPITNIFLFHGGEPDFEGANFYKLDLVGDKNIWIIYEVDGLQAPIIDIDIIPAIKINKYLKMHGRELWEPIQIFKKNNPSIRKVKSENDANFLLCCDYDISNFFQEVTLSIDQGLVFVIKRQKKNCLFTPPLSSIRINSIKKVDGTFSSDNYYHNLSRQYDHCIKFEIKTLHEIRVLACQRVKNINDSFYNAQLLDIYPDTVSMDTKAYELLPLFCFPKGIKFYLSDQNPIYYNFIFTNELGERTYISSLRFTEKLEVSPFSEIKQPVYAQKAFCLMSKINYYDKMTSILVEIYKIYGQKSRLPIERIISNLILEVPLPCPGSSSILYEINNKIFKFHFPKSYPKIPLQCYECLLSYLDTQKIVQIVEYILVEKKILLISENQSVLTLIIEALLSFIFPLKWSHVLIPVLPDSLKTYAEAPVPYIIGIVKDDTFDEASLSLSSDVIRVYLDSNEIFALDFQKHEIPSDLKAKITKKLEPFESYHKKSILMPTKKIYGVALESHKLDPSAKLGVIELRDIFLFLMSNLLNNYFNYIKTPTIINGQKKVLIDMRVIYDEAGFIKSKPETHQKFTKKICNTAGFADFIEARISGKDITYFDAFDKSIKFRQTKNSQFLQKESSNYYFKINLPEMNGLYNSSYYFNTSYKFNKELFCERKISYIKQLPLLSSEIYNKFSKINLNIITMPEWSKYILQNILTIWIMGLLLKVKYSPSEEDALLTDYAYSIWNQLDSNKLFEDSSFITCLIQVLSLQSRDAEIRDLIQKNPAKESDHYYISIYLKARIFKEQQQSQNVPADMSVNLLKKETIEFKSSESQSLLSKNNENLSYHTFFPMLQGYCKKCSNILYFEEILGSWKKNFYESMIVCIHCQAEFIPPLGLIFLYKNSLKVEKNLAYHSPLCLRREIENIIFQYGEEYVLSPRFEFEHKDIWWNIQSYFHLLKLPNPFILSDSQNKDSQMRYLINFPSKIYQAKNKNQTSTLKSIINKLSISHDDFLDILDARLYDVFLNEGAPISELKYRENMAPAPLKKLFSAEVVSLKKDFLINSKQFTTQIEMKELTKKGANSHQIYESIPKGKQ